LKIETHPRDDHQVTLVVTLEQAQMESAKRRAARKISERRSVPGFRPGKAPYDVVLRTFGEGAIVEEAVDLLLDEIYPQALEEAQIEPGAAGALEKMDDLDKEPKFTFTVPLAPKVELGDYRAVRIPYEWKEPGEEEADKLLEDMRLMYAKTDTVERPIQTGDFVLVDLKGVKSKAADGEAPLIERSSMPVFVRQEQKEDEWPFAGFAAELVGAAKSEVKAFTHKFPKDHEDETLRGQTVKFEVAVKMIRGTTLPELNDEFAKQLGPFENLQAAREALKASLASKSKADYDDEFFEKVLEAVKAGAVIRYAPQTLDHEVGHVMEDIKSRLAAQNMDLTAYLKSRQMDEEKFIAEEARPTAIRRLERTLILEELSRAEKIEVSEDELEASFNNLIFDMRDNEEIQKYLSGKAKMPKRLAEALTFESASRAYVRQTLEGFKLIPTANAPQLPP
jgi:trigger factor